jgi:hypothetical protein
MGLKKKPKFFLSQKTFILVGLPRMVQKNFYFFFSRKVVGIKNLVYLLKLIEKKYAT